MPWTFNYLVSVQYFLFGMLFFLVLNLVLVHLLLILVLDGGRVRDENLKPFFSARMAEPTPLSPAPNTTILFIFYFLFYSLFISFSV